MVSSVEDATTITAVQVYPNPAQDMFFIEAMNSELYEVTIYSASGQLVDRFTGRGRTQVQSNQMTAGVYYLHVQEKETTTIIPMMVTR